MTIAPDVKFQERHRAWDTLIAARGHIAWSDSYATPFMSAWCIYQRYCHLNHVHGTELVEPLDLRDRRRHGRVLTSFLTPAWWIPEPRAADGDQDESAFRRVLTALRNASFAIRAGSWWESVADDEHIRLCPACSKIGYHALFSQVSGIARCPIHGLPYEPCCPCCREPTPPYRLARTGDPLVCHRCRASLLCAGGASRLELPASFLQQEKDAWLGFARWLGRIRASTTSATRTEFPRRSELCESLETKARFLWVLHEIEPLPESILPYLAARPHTIRSARVLNATSSWPSSDRRVLDGSKEIERKRVFASIRRYLTRRYIHGHEVCLARAKAGFFMMSDQDGTKRSAPWEGGCHTAHAFVFWLGSMTFNHAHSSRLMEREMFMPSPANDDIRVWAHQVLFAFHERFVAIRLFYEMEQRFSAKGKRMFLLYPEVRDFDERLELQDARYRFASLVVAVGCAEVVVVGRGPHPKVGAPSTDTCGRHRRRCRQVVPKVRAAPST